MQGFPGPDPEFDACFDSARAPTFSWLEAGSLGILRIHPRLSGGRIRSDGSVSAQSRVSSYVCTSQSGLLPITIRNSIVPLLVDPSSDPPTCGMRSQECHPWLRQYWRRQLHAYLPLWLSPVRLVLRVMHSTIRACLDFTPISEIA